MLYKKLLKPILFKMAPENAHKLTVQILRIVNSTPIISSIFKLKFAYENKQLNKTVMGLQFPNPVGLAAGFDKNGTLIEPLSNLGFGFIEIGTVTPKAQPGNKTPRLFRLPKDNALINRMGFNNNGVSAMVKHLKETNKQNIIIGGNIGKNKVTPNEQAINDYAVCFEELFPYVDYFAVNVSSPNTPNLRELQNKEPLLNLLKHLQKRNQEKVQPKPILLKIAPDLSGLQLKEIAQIIKETNLTGVIATNTTISRKGLITNETKIAKMGSGGLSGQPITERSTEVIKKLRKLLGNEKVIIGVGGIHNAETAIEKLSAGADLIQVYSGLVYEGPSLVQVICREIKGF